MLVIGQFAVCTTAFLNGFRGARQAARAAKEKAACLSAHRFPISSSKEEPRLVRRACGARARRAVVACDNQHSRSGSNKPSRRSNAEATKAGPCTQQTATSSCTGSSCCSATSSCTTSRTGTASSCTASRTSTASRTGTARSNLCICRSRSQGEGSSDQCNFRNTHSIPPNDPMGSLLQIDTLGYHFRPCKASPFGAVCRGLADYRTLGFTVRYRVFIRQRL